MKVTYELVFVEGLKNYSGENGRAKLTKPLSVESQEMRHLTGVQDSQLDNDKMMARSCGFSSNGCSKAPETISEQYYASSCADCYQNSTKENSLIIPTVNTAKQRSRFSKQKASSNQIQSLKTRSLSERNQITEHGIIRKILQEMINDSKTVKKYERGDNEVGDSLAKVWKTEMGENNYMRYEKRNNIITEDTANFYSPVPENLFDLDGWQAWPG